MTLMAAVFNTQARLNLALRLFKRLVDPWMHNRFAVFQAELRQHAVHALGTENTHQIIFKR